MAWGCLASLESAFGASQNTVDGALFHNFKMRKWIKYIYARCAILKEKEYLTCSLSLFSLFPAFNSFSSSSSRYCLKNTTQHHYFIRRAILTEGTEFSLDGLSILHLTWKQWPPARNTSCLNQHQLLHTISFLLQHRILFNIFLIQ